MTRRLAMTLYVISALLFLRCAGLHVHIHNHADVPYGNGPEIVHFANGDNHGDSHAQDMDVDIFSTLLFKIQGLDLDDSVFFAAFFLIALLLLDRARYLSSRARESTLRPARHHALPLSRAPPH